MKYVFAILITIVIYNESFSIINYLPNDRLYVWAESGLNLREGKNFKSEIIKKIEFGEKVLCQGYKTEYHYYNKSITIIDEIEFSKGQEFSIELKGIWVKVKYKDIEGYIFDAYLSKLKPVKTTKHSQTIFEYFKESVGVANYLVKKDPKKEAGLNKVVLNNGLFFTEYVDSNKYGFKMIIPDFSIEEIILLFNHLGLYTDQTDKILQKKNEIFINQVCGDYSIKQFENIVTLNGNFGC